MNFKLKTKAGSDFSLLLPLGTLLY